MGNIGLERTVYFVLAIIRLAFAVSPSYLHPDEHFQGPEVVAGHLFSYKIHETWEFSSNHPTRSFVILWPIYGLPMVAARCLHALGLADFVKPHHVFWSLRLAMVGISFIQDRAIYELVQTPRLGRISLLLVSSCYVTWTWQVHTFSNSVESVLVLWSLVLVERIVEKRNDLGAGLPASLSILLVVGTFNRITFPGYILPSLLRLLPIVFQRPKVGSVMASVAIFVTTSAVLVDTVTYKSSTAPLMHLLREPVVTPLNSLLYNVRSENLALHGKHPFYQHLLINLPQLLGPLYFMIFLSPRIGSMLLAAICGVGVLSCFPHQESRFLLPAVPLILSSIRFPRRHKNFVLSAWVIFNILLGILMGLYHQGGVVPAQTYLESQEDIQTAFWWRTYSPPNWLLGDKSTKMKVLDLMGLREAQLVDRICDKPGSNAVLVAPRSSTFLDRFGRNTLTTLKLDERWSVRQHLNLDDMDFADDGLLGTINRVVGRRGLVIWDVNCHPEPPIPEAIIKDW